MNLSGIFLGLFLAALDQPMIVAALPSIGGSVEGAAAGTVLTSYLLAAAAATPAFGKGGDRFGRRPAMFVALLLFGAGALCSSLAHSAAELLLARIVQGIGAGGVLSVAQGVISELVAARLRGLYQARISICFAAAGMLGPLTAVVAAGPQNWRMLFAIEAALSLLAFVLISQLLPVLRTPTSGARLDLVGAALAAVTMAAALVAAKGFAAEQSTFALAAAAACLGFALLLWTAEKRAADAVIPPGLLKQGSVRRALLLMLTASAANYGLLTALPVLSANSSLLTRNVLTMTLASAAGSWFAGRLIARSGKYKLQTTFGALAAAAAALLIYLAGERDEVFIASLAVFSFGLGQCTPPVPVVVQASVAPATIGAAMASIATMRTLGAALGAAILGRAQDLGIATSAFVYAAALAACTAAISCTLSTGVLNTPDGRRPSTEAQAPIS